VTPNTTTMEFLTPCCLKRTVVEKEGIDVLRGEHGEDGRTDAPFAIMPLQSALMLLSMNMQSQCCQRLHLLRSWKLSAGVSFTMQEAWAMGNSKCTMIRIATHSVMVESTYKPQLPKVSWSNRESPLGNAPRKAAIRARIIGGGQAPI
jgi:hypothetical protein